MRKRNYPQGRWFCLWVSRPLFTLKCEWSVRWHSTQSILHFLLILDGYLFSVLPLAMFRFPQLSSFICFHLHFMLLFSSRLTIFWILKLSLNSVFFLQVFFLLRSSHLDVFRFFKNITFFRCLPTRNVLHIYGARIPHSLVISMETRLLRSISHLKLIAGYNAWLQLVSFPRER